MEVLNREVNSAEIWKRLFDVRSGSEFYGDI